MSDSVYRVTEVIGVSSESWEAAARNAVETAAKTIRDLRVAEVTRTDVTVENGKVSDYRVRLSISFRRDPRRRRARATAPRGSARTPWTMIDRKRDRGHLRTARNSG